MRKQYRYSLFFLSFFLLITWSGGEHASANANLPPAIISFSVDQESVSLRDVEEGLLWTNLRWHTVNMSAHHSLELDAYQLNEWHSLLDATEVLNEEGSRQINITHPLNFGEPTYRLRIVDQSKNVLDEHIFTVKYAELDENTFPEINEFKLLDASYTVTDVADNRQGMVWVEWSIANRIPGSQLVFEQVTPDGTYVSAELPREFLWIASVGQGPLSFTLAEPASDIQLRLQLRDTLTDTVLDESLLTIPVSIPVTMTSVPVATTSPKTPAPVGTVVAITPQPTIGSPTAESPEIIIFEVEPTYVKPGETYTLTWEVRPTDAVVWIQNDHLGYTTHIHEDSQGAITYTTEANPANATERHTTFRMLGPLESDLIKVEFECAHQSLVTLEPSTYGWVNSSCPGIAQTSPAAFQSFENGFMVWTETNKKIYVFNSINGMVSIYDDTWSGEDINWTESPPANYYLPQRGFGWLWINNETVRTSLGWATNPEQGYSAKFQHVHNTEGGPYNVMSLLDGSFVLMRANSPSVISWETLP